MTANNKTRSVFGWIARASHVWTYLPIYNGSVDPITWLTKCDQYFRAYQTPDEDKVWMAAFRLSDVAHSWFFQLERDEGQIPWAVFKHYCTMRFGPAVRTNTLDAIKNLQQTGMLAQYQQEYTDLLCHTSGLSRTHQIELFTAGLTEPVCTHVDSWNWKGQPPCNML